MCCCEAALRRILLLFYVRVLEHIRILSGVVKEALSISLASRKSLCFDML